MSAHNLSADQLCDALTGERIRSVELGSPLDSDQTTITIHLADSRERVDNPVAKEPEMTPAEFVQNFGPGVS